MLTGLIVLLLAILLVLVGVQTVETERRFFQHLALGVNQEVADLLAQQVVQVVTAGTGIVEDTARFPSIRRAVGLEAERESARQLLTILVERNPILRSLAVRDPSGRVLFKAAGVNVPETPGLAPKDRSRLLEENLPSLLTEKYPGGDGVLCVGFAAAVEGLHRADGTIATLEAELSLAFLNDLVDARLVGALQPRRSAQVLVVDRSRQVLCATQFFGGAQLELFQRGFSVERAFKTESGGVAYAGPDGEAAALASYRTLHSMTRKGFDARVQVPGLDPSLLTGITSAFSSKVHPREVPQWLVVVQQDAAQGNAMADRMKLNVLVLVAVGLVGLAVIARLWWDSSAE